MVSHVDANDQLDGYIDALSRSGGTDLIVSVGIPPHIRVGGELVPIDGCEVVTKEMTALMVENLLAPEQKEMLDEHKDVDFSFSWRESARIRGSAFTQRGFLSLALRIIPTSIPNMEKLGLPPIIATLTTRSKGFILVTGPTGSGKSTTLAAIIDKINTERGAHILTVEDPVEYVHTHKRAVVSQREVGPDSPSFSRALRSALREDPDVLLIGEMRDNESIQIALTMAETGHLVFATLHTNDAPQAIDRVIDVFSTDGQEQIRTQLAASLTAVVAQRLLPKIGGGMVAAYEVLIATHAIRSLIRENRTNQIPNTMLTSSDDGMLLMEKSLAELVTNGVVERADALDVAPRPSDLIQLLDAQTNGWDQATASSRGRRRH